MASTTALPPPTSISSKMPANFICWLFYCKACASHFTCWLFLLQGLCRPLHRLAVCCKACAGHFIGWLFYCKACAGRIVCRLCLLRGLCRPFHLPAVLLQQPCHAMPCLPTFAMIHACCPRFILPHSVLHSPPPVHDHVCQDPRANLQGLL